MIMYDEGKKSEKEVQEEVGSLWAILRCPFTFFFFFFWFDMVIIYLAGR